MHCACVNINVFVSKGLLESHVVSEPELGESEAEDNVSNPELVKSVLPQDSSGRRTRARGGVDKYGKEKGGDGQSQNNRTGAVSKCGRKGNNKKACKFSSVVMINLLC